MVLPQKKQAVPSGGGKSVGHRIDGRYFRSRLEAVLYILALEMKARDILIDIAPPTRWEIGIYDRYGIWHPVHTPTGKQKHYTNDHNLYWPDGSITYVDTKGYQDQHLEAEYNLNMRLIEMKYLTKIATWRKADVLALALEHGINIKQLAKDAGIKSW